MVLMENGIFEDIDGALRISPREEHHSFRKALRGLDQSFSGWILT